MRRVPSFSRPLLLAALLTFSSLAAADSPPPWVSDPDSSGCWWVTMCSAQSSTGTCDTVGNGTGDQIVLAPLGRKVTLYGMQSSATTYTCNPTVNDLGFDALSGEGQTEGTALSNSAQRQVITNPNRRLWISCPTIAGGTITITAYVCPQ